MARYNAVDQLMALATEKRADRVPPVPPVAVGETKEVNEAASAGESTVDGTDVKPRPGNANPGIEVLPALDVGAASRGASGGNPSAAAVLVLPPSEKQFRANAAARGRQFLQALRPLIPAVAGAMSLVDHGAVQAVARLLPLLGGAPGTSRKVAEAAASAEQAQEQFVRGVLELEAAHREMRKQLDGLALKTAELEDELRRLRPQVERMAAEQSAVAHEVRGLSDRARLLSAGGIILLMLVIAQMILLLILLHR